MASSTKALARAITGRNKRNHAHDAAPLLGRQGSYRYAAGSINRNQISLPTELISTTNVQVLAAPDIRSLSGSSSASSVRSEQDSDFSHISRSFLNTPVTSPETSSIDSSSPSTPEPGHVTSFFDTIPKRAATTAGVRPSSASSGADAPAIPQRAHSHSKRAHVELHHKRSLSRLTPPPVAIAGNTVIRHSVDIFAGAADPSHPFGKELAQVYEVAEEFGATSTWLDEEELALLSQGLMKFGVEDYINEITGLYGGVFEDQHVPTADAWL